MQPLRLLQIKFYVKWTGAAKNCEFVGECEHSRANQGKLPSAFLDLGRHKIANFLITYPMKKTK
jgi:hypothetical protein